MAGKRSATSNLNSNNWDEEDPPEDAGAFKKASDDTLRNRVIKVAKRRNPIGSSASGESDKNIFGKFSGFAKPATSAAATFSFLSNTAETKVEEKPKTNGISSESTSVMFKMPENKTPSQTPLTEKSERSKMSNEYYARLKGLNQSVSNWIKKHVDDNPFINLTPVFKDYEKYIDEIEKKYGSSEEKQKEITTVTTTKTTEIKTTTTTMEGFGSFQFKPPATSPSKDTSSLFKLASGNKAAGSFFGQSGTESKQSDVPKPEFSFGFKSSANSIPALQGFSFGNVSAQSSVSAGLQFGKSSTNSGEGVNKEAEEDDDEVLEYCEKCKVEHSTKFHDKDFTPVVEEDHVYTIRCKVFVKKDNQFTEKGVGSLYLKPIPNNDKMQVIVRADTALGNVLCNFILSQNIPTQRIGKKDVMLVCLPTPESKPPPVPLLLRVKSTEDADELLKTLEKHKK